MRVTNDDDKLSLEDALEHYGVLGMKWGVRKDKNPPRLGVPKGAGKTTRGVIADYNKMSNAEFFQKYAVSKSRYAKRVAKKGDPARDTPKRVAREQKVAKVVDSQKKAAENVAKLAKKAGQVVKNVATNDLVQIGAAYVAAMVALNAAENAPIKRYVREQDAALDQKRRDQTREYATMSVRSRLGEDFTSDWIVGPGGETVARGGWDQRIPNAYSDFTVDSEGVTYRRKST